MRLDTQSRSKVPAAIPPITPPASSPVTDIEIYRTANMIVARNEGDALRFASQQMERFRQRGEPKEQAIWARIGMAVDDLLFAKAEIKRSME